MISLLFDKTKLLHVVGLKKNAGFVKHNSVIEILIHVHI